MSHLLTADSEAALVAAGLPPELIAEVRTFDITAAPTGLAAKAAGQAAFTATPIAGGAFYEPGDKITLRFDLTAAGPAPTVTLSQGGITVTYARAP